MSQTPRGTDSNTKCHRTLPFLDDSNVMDPSVFQACCSEHAAKTAANHHHLNFF